MVIANHLTLGYSLMLVKDVNSTWQCGLVCNGWGVGGL